MWRMQHVRYALPSHIMGREAQRDRDARNAPGGGVAAGSRARIRTSVERTKTACPAWLDDPGMLRRKLYPEAGPGPAERVGWARACEGRGSGWLALHQRRVPHAGQRGQRGGRIVEDVVALLDRTVPVQRGVDRRIRRHKGLHLLDPVD